MPQAPKLPTVWLLDAAAPDMGAPLPCPGPARLIGAPSEVPADGRVLLCTDDAVSTLHRPVTTGESSASGPPGQQTNVTVPVTYARGDQTPHAQVANTEASSE